jgi:pimeloyl-ACP methyl ester carboxylesterase
MAGATRQLEDIILEQSQYLLSLKPEPHAEDDKKSLEEIKANVAKVKDLDLSLDTTFTGLMKSAPPSYWLDLRGYKPAEMAKEIKRPMLILHAEKDYQVTKDDYATWQEALAGKENVAFKLYPGLSHPFTKSLGTPSPADYNKPQNVSEAVIEDIADWVKKQKPLSADATSL